MSRRTAEVVIVGGGIIGASIAWHLARRGCTDVVLLDRGNEIGEGSTSRATGGFRCQFASGINIRLSLLSRDKLLRFEEEVGVDPGFLQAGYLFLAADEGAMHVLEQAQTLQRTLGLHEARMIDAAEIRRINPALRSGQAVGAAFCPTDGFIRAMNMLRGYLDGARRLKVQTLFGEEVVGLRLKDEGGRHVIDSVTTSRQEISARVVVNACGAWSAFLARMAGVKLSVTPLRRQVAITRPTDVLPQSMPMTIFTEDGFHARVRDGRVLLLLPDTPSTNDPFSTSMDENWLSKVKRLAEERLPSLASVNLDRDACWGGLYEMSPDHHAIVGFAPEVSNMVLANGSSGHGVMHSPALGQIVAEMILDGRTSLDVSALSPNRFAEGNPNVASVLL